MAQKDQNLNDYVNALSTPKAHFYREIARLTSRSVRTVERWCSLDSKTTDAKCLKVLEAKTKIRNVMYGCIFEINFFVTPIFASGSSKDT